MRGRWVIIFAHPADFTPICTSEFIALAQTEPEFQRLNCALLGLSVDSLPAHLAWVEAIHANFGVRTPFPIVEDPSLVVARAYGMLDAQAQDSATVRAVLIIDPVGVIRATLNYPANVGRSVSELLRLLCALQETDRNNVLTPEGWTTGHDTIELPLKIQQDVTEAGPAWFLRARSGQSS